MYSLKMATPPQRVKQQNGFTLVELIVVILVIGILASLAVVSYSSFASRSRDTAAAANLQTFTSAIRAAHASQGKSQLSRAVVLQALATSSPAVTDGLNASDTAVLLGKDGIPANDREFAIGFITQLGAPANDTAGPYAILTTFSDGQINAAALSYGAPEPLILPADTFEASISPAAIFSEIEAPTPNPDPEPEPDPDPPYIIFTYTKTTGHNPRETAQYVPVVYGNTPSTEFSYSLQSGKLPTGFQFDPTSGRITVPGNKPPQAQKVAAAAFGTTASRRGFTAVITEDGSVRNWGQNEAGQLARGTTTTTVLRPVTRLTASQLNVEAKDIVHGTAHGLLLDTNGNVHGWGKDLYGTNNPQPTIQPVTGLPTPIHSIAAGNGFSMISANNGDVYGWGNPAGDVLGLYRYMPVTTPEKITNLSRISEVAAGNQHALARSGTQVYSWGQYSNGQLGRPVPGFGANATPQAISGSIRAAKIAAAENYSLALTTTGEVYAWGNNSNGQLGIGATRLNNNITPTKVSGLNGLVIDGIYATDRRAFAAVKDGGLYVSGSWGAGSAPNGWVPVPQMAGKVVVDVAGGIDHAIIATDDGMAYAWGTGAGIPTSVGSAISAPTPIPEFDAPDWDFTLNITATSAAGATAQETVRFSSLP